jgi:hypothetical protein
VDVGPHDIGELTALDIGLVPRGRSVSSLGGALVGLAGGARWGLAGVEVLRLVDGARCHFPYEGWIGDKEAGTGLKAAGQAWDAGARSGGGRRGARVQLWPGRQVSGSAGRGASYRVVVRTVAARGSGSGGGSRGCWGADTTGNDGERGRSLAVALSLTLFGTGAAAPGDGAVRSVSSGVQRVEVSGDSLAPGGAAAFTLRCRDLGEVTSTTVGGTDWG